MNEKEKRKNLLHRLFQKGNENDLKKKPLHYLFIIGLIGIALMLVGNVLNKETDERYTVIDPGEEQSVFKEKQEEANEWNMMKQYEERYEKELKEVLEQMVGVEDVSIKVNFAESERNVFEKNITMKRQTTDEIDREGGTRKVEDSNQDEQLVLVRSGDREEPILRKKEKPTVRGVLVVARGVENQQIKNGVVEAVSRLLDVPSHRISVMAKK